MEIESEPLPEEEIGAVVAKGRDADVFLLRGSDDRVVRRLRRPVDLAPEAAVMEHVRAAGYPVPQVWRVAPGEMVLDRVAGPTMADDLARRPWRAAAHGRTLARLHTELHAIAAPPDLRPHPGADGDVVLHLDLHPQNVMLTADGPVVIDWSNARRGPGAADVADVWVVLACLGREPSTPTSLAAKVQAAVIDRVEPAVRRRLLDAFLADTRDAARDLIPAAAAHRLSDQNVRDHERQAIESLVAEVAGSPDG